MEYHALTPPTIVDVDDFDLQCPGGSASSIESFWPQDWSPQTVMTSATTPPKSPIKIRETGPTLLPRIRPQDQLIGMAAVPTHPSHNRTSSLPVQSFSMQFGGNLPTFQPSIERRSSTPPSQVSYGSTLAVPSPFDHMINDHASVQQRPSFANARSASTSRVPQHSRNASSSSIDAALLSRYGYPTYRQSPTPQPMGPGHCMSGTPSAMSHLAPIVLPGGHVPTYPQRRRTASPPARPSRLSVEVEFDPAMDQETSCLVDYLTAPNPTPSLTQRVSESMRGHHVTHAWFDIRNVQHWSDFNVATIAAQPQLLDLLNMQVSSKMLPQPSKVNTNPETTAQLVEACALHHAVKVNAALKVAQGDKHIVMCSLNSTHGARQQPEFISRCQSDLDMTIYGDGRGRVIGVVQSHDQWNSGMRSGSPTDKVKYLQTLAKLQRFTRDHGTRYGFVMTEIELVCVRFGGSPAEPKPLYGFVEIATPIEIATSGCQADGMPKMTAGLALWWLHMLAKDQAFDGQYHWKLDVGPPGALTRQHHRPTRDTWMPRPTQKEKREVKMVRGWVFPDEPLSKRECGKTRKGRI